MILKLRSRALMLSIRTQVMTWQDNNCKLKLGLHFLFFSIQSYLSPHLFGKAMCHLVKCVWWPLVKNDSWNLNLKSAEEPKFWLITIFFFSHNVSKFNINFWEIGRVAIQETLRRNSHHLLIRVNMFLTFKLNNVIIV